MRASDLGRYAARALLRHRLRSALILVAVAIGVCAVILLTALGEGARRRVVDEFTALGSHLLIVLPGRTETTGGPPPLLGETPRDLTLADAEALARLAQVRRMAPMVVGVAALSRAGREREVVLLGTAPAFMPLRRLHLQRGRNIVVGALDEARPEVVLGSTVARELFGAATPVGGWVRIAGRRLRVVGVLAPTGTSLGTDLDEVALVPVATAQQVFDRAGLFRVLLEVSGPAALEPVAERVRAAIRLRHDGEDDITLLTQDALVATFDRVLRALTLALGGIAAISLLVAGILIMNVTLVAVAQRRAEIGLLKALGAEPHTIEAVFLVEALLQALAGGALGVALGQAGVAAGRALYPGFPLAAPVWAVIGAVLMALACGLACAWLPARRAARADPVAALAGR